uniref:ABC transporter domain-containing protein n=1 Tax=Globisporangium ultimum (strain ATCC 200006 / CBS 805.95 / DAOM BR144) TaxID=431595 RepID=K3WZI5_GLOUD
MEVRVHDLSVTAKLVAGADNSKTQLPTIANELKAGLNGLFTKETVVHKEILKNINAVFKPGTMTLVLGQPGSGKSSLMKILSGRFPMEKNIKVDGYVTYNGQLQQDIIKRLPQFVGFVPQKDNHHPTLTVKETLEFAHTFSGGELQRRGEELLTNDTPEENKAALDASQALFSHYPDIVIEQLGLQECQGTIIGDPMLRGVSGGERKRVTMGEMQFGMKHVAFMDEISTGLDSAATFDIVSTQRSIAKKLRKTIVMSLLQPTPEVFAMFDYVMILNEGEVMYHGPRQRVLGHFESLGFICPPERDVADFLVDLGTSEQRRYETGSVGNLLPNYPKHASDFADTFRRSSIHQDMLSELATPVEPKLVDQVAFHMDPTPEFHQSFWENIWTLTKREFLVLFRNKAFVIGRGLMVLIVALLNASTFYKFDPTNIQVVFCIIFISLVFLSLGQMALIPMVMESRDIFYKQRGANFFRTSAYVLANAASQIPLLVVEALLFGAIVYWLCGFTASASAFFTYEILLLLTNMVFSAWFFFIASASPNFLTADPLATFTVLVFILFAGFVALKSQIPDFLIWLYWVSPYSWSIRAIAVNEYRSPKYDVCTFGDIDYCGRFENKTMGQYYLSLFDVQPDKEWIMYGVIYLIAAYVVCLCCSIFVLENVRYETPENVAAITKKSDADEQGNYAIAETPKFSSINARRCRFMKDRETAVAMPSPIHVVTPVTIAFSDLWYTVPQPNNPKQSIDLLQGISGYALPGTMTALMGASGAGKTTLMDVIAGRKTGGQARGKVLLNGHEATDLAIRRCTGYCEQIDSHSSASTFREALTFSAFLRQDSSIPDSQKYDSVNECMDLLDMHDIGDQIIRGSSAERMKRLTIGVELAAQPSVLFLDEPTSGLDARSAKLIMDGVRKVANTGRTIVCTIHQPSSEVFFLFDKLLLLKRGGKSVFFGELGERCCNLVDYFQAIPGIAPLPRGYNPATWMLECIGAGVNNDSVNDIEFPKCFIESEQKRALDNALTQQRVGRPAPGAPELLFSQKRAASSGVQAQFVIKRFFDLYWRTPDYNLTRLVLALVLALLFGLVFTEADYKLYQGVTSGVNMIALAIMFMGLTSFDAIIPMTGIERASFYRERAAQTYNVFWYLMGSTLAELPYVFAAGLIFTAVFFPLVGFAGFSTAVVFWLNLSFVILYHAYLGQLLAYALPSAEVAVLVGMLVTSICFLFMGFVPPASAIPSGYKWLYNIIPHRYSLAVLVALVFTDCPSDTTFDSATGAFINVGTELGCQPLQNTPIAYGNITVKEFIEDVFEMKHDDLWTNFAVVVGITVLFRVLALLSLRFINHRKA